MLDETARKKGRKKLILGARVGPSLATDPGPFVYPGIYDPENLPTPRARTWGWM